MITGTQGDTSSGSRRYWRSGTGDTGTQGDTGKQGDTGVAGGEEVSWKGD